MKKLLIGCLAIALLFTVAAPQARAQDSRAQSLLFNLSFEDQTDVFLFPHLLGKYEGLYFHLPGVITNVNGGLIYDLDGSALGLFVHRSIPTAFDQYRIMVTDAGLNPGANVLAGMFPGNPGAASEAHIAGQIFDLMYGTDKWGIGLRLWLFSDVSQQEGHLADPAENTGAFTTMVNAGFNLSPGFDMRGGLGFRMEDWQFRVFFRIIMAQEGKEQLKNFSNSHAAAQIVPGEGRIRDAQRARQYLEKYFDQEKISVYWGTSEEFLSELVRDLEVAA